MTPSRRLIIGLNRSKLSYCLESFANALVDPHRTEGGTYLQFVHTWTEEGGGLVSRLDTVLSHS